MNRCPFKGEKKRVEVERENQRLMSDVKGTEKRVIPMDDKSLKKKSD